MKKNELLDIMRSRSGRITTAAARKAGYSASLLRLLEEEGSVERESRGVYALVTVPPDDFAVMALRWSRLVFSHGSALYLHGLSDRTPSRIDVTCPHGYRSNALFDEFPGTRVHAVVPERFEVGLSRSFSPTGTSVLVYDPERCICDLLRQRRQGKVDSQLFSGAINSYMKSKEKNLPKLARYAERLGVAKELRECMEVLA